MTINTTLENDMVNTLYISSTGTCWKVPIIHSVEATIEIVMIRFETVNHDLFPA